MSVNTLYQQCIHHDQPGTLQQDVREQTNRIENLILSRLPLKVQAGSIDAETSTESISESINLYVSSVVCTSGKVHAVPIATTINDEPAETRAAGILNELGRVMKDAGGELLKITKGSIRFHLRFQSLENLQRFKEKCSSGELGRELAGILLSDDIKKDAGSDELAIQVTFSESEYQQGFNFFKNIGKDVKDIRVQLPTRIREWSKEHVRHWLLQNHLDSEATQFFEEDVTGQALLVYTLEILVKDFNFKKGPARVILSLRDEWARTGGETSSSSSLSMASSSSSKGETINCSIINKINLDSSKNAIIYVGGINVETQSCNCVVPLQVIDAESGVNMDSLTNELFEGLKEVTKNLKRLESLAAVVENFGGHLRTVDKGSIRLVVQFCHLKGLDAFNEKCLSGELAAELSKILLTEDVKKSADCELAIRVTFEKSQYRKGRSYFMSSDTTEVETQVDRNHSDHHHHEQATKSSKTRQPLQPCTELFEPCFRIPTGTGCFQTLCAYLDGDKRWANLADHVFGKGKACHFQKFKFPSCYLLHAIFYRSLVEGNPFTLTDLYNVLCSCNLLEAAQIVKVEMSRRLDHTTSLHSNNVVHLPRDERIRIQEMTARRLSSSWTTGKRSKGDEDSDTKHTCTSQMTTHQQVLRPKDVARIPMRRHKTTGPHLTHTTGAPEVLSEVTRTVSLPSILLPSDDSIRAIKNEGQSTHRNVKNGLHKNMGPPKGYV